MDEESSTCVRAEFLKKLGVTAQREIELAMQEQLDAGELEGEGRSRHARPWCGGLPNEIVVNGEIELA